MEAVELYRKHRPTSFKEMVGQKDAIKSLNEMGKAGKIPKCIMFTGPSGCGKTTLARILVKKLECAPIGYTEINAAECRGIDGVRDILKQMGSAPLEGKVKIWVIDECQKLTDDAQSALLKILEETPSHVYFFLATTDPGKVIKAIHTRCTPIHCTLVSSADLTDLIGAVAQKEGIDIDDEVISKISDSADGSPRMALVLLHSVINIKSKEDQLAAIAGSDPNGEAYKLAYKLMSASTWMPIAEFLKSLKEEPETIRRVVLACCLAELGKKDNAKAHVIIEEFREPIYQTGKAGVALLWSSCYAIVKS